MARIRRQLLGCALLLVGAAGFAASSKAKAKRKSKPGGFGASAKPPKAVDALSLLRTSEELYDSLEEKYELSDEAVRCRSFIVAARADGARLASSSVTSLGALSDWVPIASLLLVTRDDTPAERVRADALASLCRELGECVRSSEAKPPPGVPLAALEYAVEPVDSFLEHVHDAVLGAQDGEKGGDIARRGALRALGVSDADADADPRAVRRAYRALAARLHPDAQPADASDAARAAAKAEFARVSAAYQALGGSAAGAGAGAEPGRSWYEGLGGRERGDAFSGALALEGMAVERDAMRAPLASGGWRAAVSRLDSDVIHAVASRNTMRAALAIDPDAP